MDVTIKVNWQDGQVTHHQIANLPELAPEALAELLDQELVDWLEPDELPFAADGSALSWGAIEIVAGAGFCGDVSCEVDALAC